MDRFPRLALEQLGAKGENSVEDTAIGRGLVRRGEKRGRREGRAELCVLLLRQVLGADPALEAALAEATAAEIGRAAKLLVDRDLEPEQVRARLGALLEVAPTRNGKAKGRARTRR